MTIETAIIIGAVLALQAVMLFRTWLLASRLRILRRVQITADDPVLPDVAIVNRKPYAFPVGKKTLYLQALSHEMHRRFISYYSEFLGACGSQLSGLRLIESSDDPALKAAVLEKWRAVSFSKTMNTNMRLLISECFLKDKRVNPDGVRWKDIKVLGWDTVLELWQLASARNLEAVEDFINALSAKLAGRLGTQKHGSNYRSSAESRLTPQFDSRCQPRSSTRRAQMNTQQGNTTQSSK